MKTNYTLFKSMLTAVMLFVLAGNADAQRITQKAGRGVVAIDRTNNSQTRFGTPGKLISWRKLAQEPEGTMYNLYQQTNSSGSWTKLASNLKKTNYVPTTLTNDMQFAVAPVINGVEGEMSTPYTYKTPVWPNAWFKFDFDNNVITRNDYRTKYCWPMDLDGDGDMDAVVVDRLYAGAGGSDDAESGADVNLTTSHKIQAYMLDGTLLWTVDMGPNINICGGQNDMVVAYDINCDGKCEVIIKSSDGTRFWDKANNTWGKYANGSNSGDTDNDGVIDYSSQASKLPPFYVSVIDGQTGAEIDCSELNYSQVHDGSDTYTRNSRAKYMSFGYAVLDGHFSICYVDGIHPALVMECLDRGTDKNHHNYVFSWEYDWNNGTPTNWHHSSTWSRNDKRPWPAEFHQLRVADVDGDGFDEMCQGGYAVNPVKGTFHSPGIGHGDRWILSDINPDRPGMECFAIQQSALLGQIIYDPATGERIKEWYLPSVYDVGRGACMDIDPNHKGYEIFSFTDDYLYDCTGTPTGETRSQWNIKTMFEGVWWNDDLLREEISSPGGSGYGTNMMITNVRGKGRMIEFSQESSWASHGGTGTRPAFMGDVVGDWREEVILAVQNENSSTGLVGYTTNLPTNYSIYWLQQDPHYRGDITTRGYYQHPNTSFYLGAEMPTPPLPPVMQTDLRYKSGEWNGGFTSFDQKQNMAFADGKSVIFDVSGDNSNPIDIPEGVKPSAIYIMSPLKHEYTFNGNIGGGAVYKSMLGTSTINGDITSTDSLIISEGTLAVNGTIGAPLSLKAKGTLAGNTTIENTITFEYGLNYEGCRLSPGTQDNPFGVITFNKDLQLPGGVFVEVNLQTEGETAYDKVKVNGDLTLKGENTLSFVLAEESPAAGEYVIMECTGTLTADTEKIKTRGLVGLNYSIEVKDNQLILNIRETRQPAEGLVWTGHENKLWDYQSENFKLDDSNTAFVANDQVVFNDEAEQFSVTLTDKMVTKGVHFTNENKNYSFSGNGGFSGEGDFVKDGKGTVVLSSTNSDYTGTTYINSGTVEVANMENAGTPSALGAGKNIQIAKGTLKVNHTNAATDKSITLTDSAGIYIPNGTLTLQSALRGANGTLVKKGSGQLNINYGGTNNWKATILEAGTLSQGAWNATIGQSGSAIHVTGNSTIRVFNNNSTSAVPSINNAIEVDKGKTLTIGTGQRCKVQGSLKGEGTVKISYPYVRGDFGTDVKNFSGTLNVTSGEFHITKALELSNGTLKIDGDTYAAGYQSQSSSQTSMTQKIGALSSTSADAKLGTSVWNVGYLGTNTTFAGVIQQAATLNKYGEGTLTLTGASQGAINIYEGEVVAGNTSAPTTAATITIRSGGLLDGTGQTQNVNVLNGGTLGAGPKNAYNVSTITIKGNLTMADGAILRVRSRSTSTKTSCDAFSVGATVKLTSPVIDISQIGTNDYVDDAVLQIFTGNGKITINGEPTIMPEVPKAGFIWDTSELESAGIIKIIPDPNATAISEINADPKSHTIYDMSGRRLNSINGHGIFIIDGVKIIR
jgi:autotransporter-associated beta strand protein